MPTALLSIVPQREKPITTKTAFLKLYSPMYCFLWLTWNMFSTIMYLKYPDVNYPFILFLKNYWSLNSSETRGISYWAERSKNKTK